MKALAAIGLAALGVIGAALALHTSASRATPASRACGFERWSVKTLTDPAARLVNFRPRPTSVAALRRLHPTGTPTRGPGVERTTYRIHVQLEAIKIEADEDVHLVVGDLHQPSLAMIVEFPASNCTVGAAARRRAQMQAARASLLHACGPASDSYTDLQGTAAITGVGFFDFIHGQRGVAPNGIELHPVLGFTRARCTAL